MIGEFSRGQANHFLYPRFRQPSGRPQSLCHAVLQGPAMGFWKELFAHGDDDKRHRKLSFDTLYLGPLAGQSLRKSDYASCQGGWRWQMEPVLAVSRAADPQNVEVLPRPREEEKLEEPEPS